MDSRDLEQPDAPTRNEVTFVLVHGAWHGAWCWERLTPELQALGHHVVTVDLPCDDLAATFETYADVVLEAMPNDPSDVVLVGHSLGGMTIPLVAARRPVLRLVYLCAVVPIPGCNYAEQLEAEPDTALPEWLAGIRADEQGLLWLDRQVARETLYNDCAPADADAAFDRLRLQALAPWSPPCPLTDLPDIDSTYIVAANDRIVNPEWSRRVGASRANADLVEIPGDHSPFLSRPAGLARLLHDCAHSTTRTELAPD